MIFSCFRLLEYMDRLAFNVFCTYFWQSPTIASDLGSCCQRKTMLKEKNHKSRLASVVAQNLEDLRTYRRSWQCLMSCVVDLFLVWINLLKCLRKKMVNIFQFWPYLKMSASQRTEAWPLPENCRFKRGQLTSHPWSKRPVIASRSQIFRYECNYRRIYVNTKFMTFVLCYFQVLNAKSTLWDSL